MIVQIFEIAAGIVVGIVLLALLPAILGAILATVVGVLYAVLEPVAFLKWLYNVNRPKAPQAPVEPFNAKAVVDKYMAEYAKRDDRS